MLSPAVQESVAKDLLNAPSRKDIQLSSELDDRLVVYGESGKNVIWFDPALAAKVRPQWTEQLNQKVAPSWGQ
jgi:ABC-type thiamine transport system substrate-binding protein